MNCVFCGILENKVKHFPVYEDDVCKAFLDQRPVNPGMVLIIPKQHVNHISDLDDEVAAHLMKVAQKISRKIFKELSPKRVGYVVSGYGVAHVHLIVIPTYDGHDITSRAYASIDNGKIVFEETNIAIAKDADQEEIMRKIKLEN